MGDSKRWTVTYTKHIKQKRKVYQDGALEHHNNKVFLYDDSGKVIDCRFMKKDEVVKCGETLTFDGYLVDIGDPEGNHEPLKDLNVQGRDKKSVETISTLNGLKKVDAGNIGATQGHFNLLKKIKQEDKKSELHYFRTPQNGLKATKIKNRGSKLYRPQNSEASKNCSNPIQTTAREWQALYTTQITQKAKKYHDGIIRLEFCSSHQKQVLLYDASRKLLDSRFLKKDEVVRSGETVVFDSHLVDIGDPEASSLDSVVVSSKHTDAVAGAGLVKSSRERTRMQHEQKAKHESSSVGNKESELVNGEAQQNLSNLMQDKIREWHALYTTQVTQKAKKYHDGVLQLALCVSHRKQVILLNEDGTILSRKYLNSSEDVKSGCTLEVTNYLVEIGEPKISQGGESQNDACSGKHVTVGTYSSRFSVDKIKLSPNVARRKPVINGESQNNASSGKHVTVGADSSRFSLDKTKISPSNARMKQIRDGQSQDDTASGKHVGAYSSSFNVDKIKFSISDARSKPMRDVHQILFTLKKPMAPESLAPSRKPPMQQIFSSQSSDSFQYGLEEKLLGKNVQEPKSSKRNAVDDHEDKCGNLNGDSDIQMGCYRSGISQSKAHQHLPTSGIVDLIDPDHSNVREPDSISNVSLGVAASDISKSKADVGNPDKSMANSYLSGAEPQDSDIVVLDLPEKITLNSTPSFAEPQDSDVVELDLPDKITANSYPSVPVPRLLDVVVLDLPDESTVNPYSSVVGHRVSDVLLDSRAQDTSMTHDGLRGTAQIRESQFFTSSEGSGGKGSGSAKDVKEENSNQVSADKMGTDNRLEGGLLSTIDAALDSPNDADRESREVFNIIPEEKLDMDEFPSFDLGF